MFADLLCMLSLFGVVFFFITRKMKNARSGYNLALQSLATSFGFSFNPNHAFQGIVMSGTLASHRCDISFETVRRRSRNNRSSTYMHVTIALNVPTQLGLSMTRQGFLSEGFRLPDSITGNQDIIIGEETFDETYRVKGIDENDVRAYFTPQRIMAILQIQNSLGPLQNLTLTDQQVSVRFPNVMSDMNMISETANALVWLAQQLET